MSGQGLCSQAHLGHCETLPRGKWGRLCLWGERVRDKVKNRKMRETQRKINRESELWERQTQRGGRQQMAKEKQHLVGCVLGSGKGPASDWGGAVPRQSPSLEEDPLVLREARSATCKETLVPHLQKQLEEPRAEGHTWQDGKKREAGWGGRDAPGEGGVWEGDGEGD